MKGDRREVMYVNEVSGKETEVCCRLICRTNLAKRKKK